MTTGFDPTLRRLIAVLLLGGVMGLLDGTIVAVGADTLAERFDVGLASVGWVSTAYLLAVTVAIPLTAWAGERFGTKRLWLCGLALFLLGSVAAGAAWDIGSLIASRVVQGLGGGTLEPIMLTLLARAAGPARAGRVMGVMGIVLSLGPVLGPVLGGVIIQTLDWRWMFFVNLPIGLLALVCSARLVPADPPPPEHPARLDVVGLALLSPGFGMIVFGLSRVEHGGTPLVGLLGAALLLAYGVHALRTRRTAPLLDPRLFRNGRFAATVLVMSAMGACMFSILFALPLHHQVLGGQGVLAAGLAVAPFGVGSALAMPVAGRFSDTLGARRLAFGGAVVAAVAALGLALSGNGLLASAALTFVMGAGLGTVGASSMGAMYRTLPPESVAQGSSALFILNQLGASLGIAAVSVLAQGWGVHSALWWVVAVHVVILAGSPLLPGKLAAARPEPAPAR
ncbi:DHA2 family efflux MFS transporter permease subunit [Actinokineospora sp. PR83]|uniref:DHA2 family efflux MFS transporter permease subunit n=1 Tax=Actinokineospora sp. PR83 TaxID=2884908 RepID=UPI001F3ECCF2|nr:DHA2 family efflux MFS transporter permease subunit [Actinokineospora sp. PR83]MCG8918760.1 DHA2 family efflux MFS transporter permease subunit [Actinokineospora sp. PR83]